MNDVETLPNKRFHDLQKQMFEIKRYAAQMERDYPISCGRAVEILVRLDSVMTQSMMLGREPDDIIIGVVVDDDGDPHMDGA